MNEKKRIKEEILEIKLSELKKGAKKYVGAFIDLLVKLEFHDPKSLGKEMLMIGYAAGVTAGKWSDAGLEGFSLLLNGIKLSMECEDRKEEINFAIWDKKGNLHTSEEGIKREKGGTV